MIERSNYLERIKTGLGRSPVVALIGPRQCGKTTLARELVAADSLNYFDLEDPATALALQNPMSALSGLTGLVFWTKCSVFLTFFQCCGSSRTARDNPRHS